MVFRGKENSFRQKRKLYIYFSADKIPDTLTSLIRHVSQPKSATQPKTPWFGFESQTGTVQGNLAQVYFSLPPCTLTEHLFSTPQNIVYRRSRPTLLPKPLTRHFFINKNLIFQIIGLNLSIIITETLSVLAKCVFFCCFPWKCRDF